MPTRYGSTRIAILEGFDSFPRRRRGRSRRRVSASMRRQQGKMKKCALKWKRKGGRGSYTRFMQKCLKGR